MTLLKFWISSMKSITWEWNHITVGHLWRLYGGQCTAWVRQPLITLLFETSVRLGWQHSAWALYWICFSFDLLLIYVVLCTASCSTGIDGCLLCHWFYHNCLTVGLLNVVAVFLPCKMSFAFSISYINVSEALRTKKQSLKTVGYWGKLSYCHANTDN